MTDEIHHRWMKSLRDEIPLREVEMERGTNIHLKLCCSFQALTPSPAPQELPLGGSLMSLPLGER